jgi:hypothetical protein
MAQRVRLPFVADGFAPACRRRPDTREQCIPAHGTVSPPPGGARDGRAFTLGVGLSL